MDRSTKDGGTKDESIGQEQSRGSGENGTSENRQGQLGERNEHEFRNEHERRLPRQAHFDNTPHSHPQQSFPNRPQHPNNPVSFPAQRQQQHYRQQQQYSEHTPFGSRNPRFPDPSRTQYNEFSQQRGGDNYRPPHQRQYNHRGSFPSQHSVSGGGPIHWRPQSHNSVAQQHHHHQQQQQLQPIESYDPNEFPVQPLDRFKTRCASFRQPIEIGSFSYTPQREFVMDDSQLKYYYPPDLRRPNNLSDNYEKYISRDLMVDEHIDALLEALVHLRAREENVEDENIVVNEAKSTTDQQQQATTTGGSAAELSQSDNNSDKGTGAESVVETEEAVTESTENIPPLPTESRLPVLTPAAAPVAPSATLPKLPKNITSADFVCYRGILTKIMCTPYTRNEPWTLRATKFRGTIYIEDAVSMTKREENLKGMDSKHQLMTYWGYRFETICNISKPVEELRRIPDPLSRSEPLPFPGPPPSRGDSVAVKETNATTTTTTGVEEKGDDKRKRTRSGSEGSSHGEHELRRPGAPIPAAKNVDQNNSVQPLAVVPPVQMIVDPDDPELLDRRNGIVDTNLQYCTVAKTKIGQNTLIMGAEVDCITEPKKPFPHNPLPYYVELKTSKVIMNDRDRNSFEKFKLLKFWAQSFLPGIPTIIVGFRDNDGNVKVVETLKTMEIPRMVRGQVNGWDSTVCINFLNQFLDFLKSQIVVETENDAETTFDILWQPPFKSIQVHCAGKQNRFLTDKYLQSFFK